ncbi:MAG: hypothetical protein K2U26_17150 [Cyclobacteriaceae bacterium]|nr:hypothetical protein [Cyclobacteriaceae bacterium]
MKAVEFKAKIKSNRIEIPKRLHKDLSSRHKSIRVIMLMDDAEGKASDEFHQLTKEQFFKGYAKTDSIYDGY